MESISIIIMRYLGHWEFKILNLISKAGVIVEVIVKEDKELHEYRIKLRKENGKYYFKRKPRKTSHIK